MLSREWPTRYWLYSLSWLCVKELIICYQLIRTMDYTLVLGLLVILVVGFFGYQWISKLQVKKAPGKKAAMASGPVTSEEEYPDIPGQTTEEAKTKEPNQRREPSSQQQPVDNAGNAPAQFDQHLRHPEQVFHHEGQQHGNQPQSNAAQNDGPVLGTPLFAFNGMEMMDSGSGLPPF